MRAHTGTFILVLIGLGPKRRQATTASPTNPVVFYSTLSRKKENTTVLWELFPCTEATRRPPYKKQQELQRPHPPQLYVGSDASPTRSRLSSRDTRRNPPQPHYKKGYITRHHYENTAQTVHAYRMYLLSGSPRFTPRNIHTKQETPPRYCIIEIRFVVQTYINTAILQKYINT